MRQRGVFWHHVFAGVLIGTGCVLPGVSGGVMAVSFGLYRPMGCPYDQILIGPVRGRNGLLPSP